MLIRQAKPSDAGQIAEIYNPYIRNSVVSFEEIEVSAETMASRIEGIGAAGFPFIVSETDGRICGYAYASQWKSRAAYRHSIEVSIYLRPDAQKQGIATSLYTELFRRLSGRGHHAVIAVITLPNEASVRLHEGFGFKKVAHFAEVGHKFEKWVDVGYWQAFTQDLRP